MTRPSSDSRPSASSGRARDALEPFRTAFVAEHARTERILRAFPREQAAFKPHERSNDAKQLAWMFVVEESTILKALSGEAILGSGFPKAPPTWDEVLQAFASSGERVTAALRSTDGAALAERSVEFFVAPRQTGKIPAIDLLWFMLFDQIHHRGQLSVYVRMTGGKVPSIYGPSADEPWT